MKIFLFLLAFSEKVQGRGFWSKCKGALDEMKSEQSYDDHLALQNSPAHLMLDNCIKQISRITGRRVK
ncbi:Oidioi.mRNA.OKI2018_I69.chr1.g1760.t1.cds [Oikopleura dioica]|uniref:Oidioi.mRNA.OKI2018_I69.chr1.g1760.t1.cds n=1 Tax=Oikopleura dioica TaxID=34765 RepID=A0ABN7ST45_OIKDI|nr:Oidioi.mRNA.OKI2018_I69.chr1.g1760.t1.cds [Oikopleura dioica]